MNDERIKEMTTKMVPCGTGEFAVCASHKQQRDFIEAAIREAVAEAREEAAKALEAESKAATLADDPWDKGYRKAMANGAAIIRALEKP